MIQHHCRLLRESLLVKEAHVDPTDIDRENNAEQQHHDYALVLPKTYFFLELDQSATLVLYHCTQREIIPLWFT